MHVSMTFYFEPTPAPPEQAYDHLLAVLPALGQADPRFTKWWLGPRTPKDGYVPFDNKDAALARIEGTLQSYVERFAGTDLPSTSFMSLLVTNAGNERAWKENGRVALSYRPSQGQLNLSISDADSLFRDPHETLWSMLMGIASQDRLTLANTNVRQKVSGELKLYSTAYAVFPHREFLGWMGYVPRQLTADQVPDAARLEVVGNGTCILATDTLDLSQPTSIQQANKVEISLADLNLLAITNPSLT